MQATHKSFVHGKCPINGRWDYYEVVVCTDDFVEVSELEDVLDSIRGTNKTQEELAKYISLSLPYSCVITLHGRHSQNTKTSITCDQRKLVCEVG
jgi:hypothetical protein